MQNAAANKVSNAFGGTRDKCAGCSKTVYPIEKVTRSKLCTVLFLEHKKKKKLDIGITITFCSCYEEHKINI